MSVKHSHGLDEYKNKFMIELSQAQLKKNRRSNLFKATLEEICIGAGISQRSFEKYLTKQNIPYGIRTDFFLPSRRNNYFICFIGGDIPRNSIILYIITRIAPLYHEIKHCETKTVSNL